MWKLLLCAVGVVVATDGFCGHRVVVVVVVVAAHVTVAVAVIVVAVVVTISVAWSSSSDFLLLYSAIDVTANVTTTLVIGAGPGWQVWPCSSIFVDGSQHSRTIAAK